MEAEVINQLNNTLNDLEKRSEDIRVYMDYQGKKDRLEEVIGLSEDPELWNDPKRAQEIGKERKILRRHRVDARQHRFGHRRQPHAD